MSSGFNNGGSRRRDGLPMLGQLYKCSFCPKTITSLHARGSHMTKRRQEVKENRRKHAEYMGNKHRESSPRSYLSPNKGYWRRYRKDNIKPREIAFVPFNKPWALPEDVELSHDSLASEGVVTALTVEDKDKGGEVEIPDDHFFYK